MTSRLAKRGWILLPAIIAALATGCGMVGGRTATAVENYGATLDGLEQVPQTQTNATGTATVRIRGGEVGYTLFVRNISDVTSAHIHRGPPGVVGPPVVTLFTSAGGTGAVSDTLASGTVRAASLPIGMTMDSLVTLIRRGNAYVNVHTRGAPAGLIRGQLVRGN